MARGRSEAHRFIGKVAVVGFGEVPTGKFPNRPCLASALESCRQAILDSGIDKDEIDTIIPTGTFFNRRYNTDMVFSKLVEELGLLGKAKVNMQVFAGGSSSSSMLKVAAGLIDAGLSNAVLCVQSDKTGSAPVQEMIDLFATFGIPEEWETPYGFFMGGCGSLFATRYMYETGTTREQLASVVVSMRKWAVLNPNAMLRRELPLEEVLSSKPVATNMTSREGNVLADGGSVTVNKVCGSGLKAVMFAAQAVATGEFDVVVAGGMESMSQAPYLLKKGRAGYRLGHDRIFDHVVGDGLWDPYDDVHMGNLAERLSREHGIGREEQDAYAASSYGRALAAIKAGAFAREIVGVPIPQKKGDPVVFAEDEEPGRGNVAKLGSLKPAFEKDGTVTAGNASSINDGAAAVVVTSAETARKRDIRPLARIAAYATASREPAWFTLAPVDAIRKVLQKGGVDKDRVGLFEINEAFSSVAIAAVRSLGLDRDRVNVRGGAVALGHPIGASGARILATLLYAMEERNEKLGVASLCIGGGEAVAMLLERT